LYYRFALLTTCRLRLVEGLEATTANVFVLRSLLRDAVVRGDISERDLTENPTQEWVEQFRASVEETFHRIRADAGYLLPEVEKLATDPAQSPAARLMAAQAAQRIATFAEIADTRRRWLRVVHALAEQLNRPDSALVAVLEELEQSIALESSFPEKSIIDASFFPTSEIADLQPFDEVWRMYEALRRHLHGPVQSGNVPGLLDAAFRHFEYLRWLITKKSGPIGHLLSFGLSQRLQVLGRDLISFHIRRGDARASLEIAERVKARALGDFMSRQHFVSFDRIPASFRNKLVAKDGRGNVQSVAPATVREMALSVYDTGSALLVFVRLEASYVGWRILPNGDLSAWVIDEPQADIAAIFSALPYFDDAATMRSVGGLTRHFAHRASEPGPQVPDAPLRSLWQRLIPENIEKELKGCTRLTIVPDAELEYIPFGALRMRDGRYVVEAFETLYWPSVTAGMSTESDYRARCALLHTGSVPYYKGGNVMVTSKDVFMAQLRKRAAVYGRRAAVLGNPEFITGDSTGSDADAVQLPPLPGAQEEAQTVARLLGVKAASGKDASLDTLAREAHDVCVVHIATHAIADASDPKKSFIALADGRLTAQALYSSGLGFGSWLCEAGLVVLSACQTGLGAMHPDSVINLANGFLIAGANSVLSTLWSIRDDGSMRLMTRFYELLVERAQGKPLNHSLPAALRTAQLERLRDPATCHPVFWAAFKITGSAQNPLALQESSS
jgi:CHAT domain-containing protein